LVSSYADAIAAGVECLDGGGFDFSCASNVAGTFTPFVSGKVIQEVVIRFGPPLAELLAQVGRTVGVGGCG
jgi:hypothetical protein